MEPDSKYRTGEPSPLMYVKEHINSRPAVGIHRADIDRKRQAMLDADGSRLYGIYRLLCRFSGDRSELRGLLVDHRGQPVGLAQLSKAVGESTQVTLSALRKLCSSGIGVLRRVDYDTALARARAREALSRTPIQSDANAGSGQAFREPAPCRAEPDQNGPPDCRAGPEGPGDSGRVASGGRNGNGNANSNVNSNGNISASAEINGQATPGQLANGQTDRRSTGHGQREEANGAEAHGAPGAGLGGERETAENGNVNENGQANGQANGQPPCGRNGQPATDAAGVEPDCEPPTGPSAGRGQPGGGAANADRSACAAVRSKKPATDAAGVESDAGSRRPSAKAVGGGGAGPGGQELPAIAGCSTIPAILADESGGLFARDVYVRLALPVAASPRGRERNLGAFRSTWAKLCEKVRGLARLGPDEPLPEWLVDFGMARLRKASYLAKGDKRPDDRCRMWQAEFARLAEGLIAKWIRESGVDG